jgi:hypothetical protein
MPDQTTPSDRGQHYQIAQALVGLGYTTRDARLLKLTIMARRPVRAFAALRRDEAASIIRRLETSLEVQGK